MHFHGTHSVNYPFLLAKRVSLLFLLLMIPLIFLLPMQASFENGPIENLQVFVLFLGSLFSLYLRQCTNDTPLRRFHLWCAVLLLLIVFRELNWGRVFFPIGMEHHGPRFLPMSEFPWRIEVYALLTVYIGWLLLALVRWLPVRSCRRHPYRMLHGSAHRRFSLWSLRFLLR